MAARSPLSLGLLGLAALAPAACTQATPPADPAAAELTLAVSGAIERRLRLTGEGDEACIATRPTAPPHPLLWVLRFGDRDRGPRFRLEFPVAPRGTARPGFGIVELRLEGRQWDLPLTGRDGMPALEVRAAEDFATGSFTLRGMEGSGAIAVEGRWRCPAGLRP
jgi:hypothetical protein